MTIIQVNDDFSSETMEASEDSEISAERGKNQTIYQPTYYIQQK